MLRIPKRIVKRALQIAAKKIDRWPEDEWFYLDEEWDLNLNSGSYQGVKQCRGSIYRVVDGSVRTDDWQNIIDFVPVEDQYVNDIVFVRQGYESV